MTQLIFSRRLWLACLIFIGIISLKSAPYILSAGIVLVAFLFDTATLRPLKNYRFWLIVSFLVILVPIFTGDQDATFLGIGYSTVQLDVMIVMALRGIDVFLLFQILSTNLDSNKARRLFQKLGISHFDILFTISKETLPRIRSILTARTNQFHNPSKRRFQFRQFIPFSAAVIQDMINMAESYSTEPEKQNFRTPQRLFEIISKHSAPQLLVISGDPGTGKTPWIAEFLSILEDTDHQAGGLISEKVIQSSERWFHQLRSIADNSVMALNTMDRFDTDIHVGKFYFYPHTLDWGVAALLKVMDKDWVIIDEIGYLEFQKNGFFPALLQMDEYFKGHLVLTVRSSLFAELDKFLDDHLPSIAGRQRHAITLDQQLSIPKPESTEAGAPHNF